MGLCFSSNKSEVDLTEKSLPNVNFQSYKSSICEKYSTVDAPVYHLGENHVSYSSDSSSGIEYIHFRMESFLFLLFVLIVRLNFYFVSGSR